jgi:hypothetical protein
MEALVRHAPPILASFACWQGVAACIEWKGIQHEHFQVIHHAFISAVSVRYLWRAFANYTGSEAANTDVIYNLQGAPGDRPNYVVGYIFLGYLFADILNRHKLKRPFKALDWLHHGMAATYPTLALLTLPPGALDAPLTACQELSSIFLALMELNYKNAAVKAAFISLFFITRIGLGGWATVMRTRLYFAGLYPSASVLVFWWAQLALNGVYSTMIARKFVKLFKSMKTRTSS